MIKKSHHKKMHHKKKMEHHSTHYESADPMMGEDHHEKKHHTKKKMWIAGAIKHPGSLRKELHIKKGHKIPEAKLEKAAHHKGKEGKRARLAITLKKLRHKK
jgi:hypothetical protein